MFSAFIQVAVVAGGAFVLLGLALSYFKYERLHEASQREGGAAVSPRDALQLRISGRLGLGRRAAPFVVAVAAPPPGAEGPPLEDALLRQVRHTDEVRPLEGGRVGLVLDLEPERAGAVFGRLRAALPAGDGAAPLRIGAAAHPRDGATAAGLLARAEAALGQDLPANAAAGEPAAADAGAGDPVDPLTGVLRAEDVSLAMHKFVARCRREGRPVSLLYADVHDLAGINDRYGRAVGDAVLRALGGLLQRWLREDDLIGRLGDDDFLAALACAPADAVLAAERILAQVRETAVAAEGRSTHFTLNLGIAGHPDHGGTTRVLFDAAEAALAAARRKGRNAWAVYEPVAAGPLRRPAERLRDRL